MILSSNNAKSCTYNYPEAIQTALDWITQHDVAHMEPGIYEIYGHDLYMSIQDITTQPYDKCYPERHNKYLDIQYVVSGVERMGYVPYTGDESVLGALEERDLFLYKELENETFVDVLPDCYCIFFSNDIHRPGCAARESGKVRKVVAKINQALLK